MSHKFSSYHTLIRKNAGIARIAAMAVGALLMATHPSHGQSTWTGGAGSWSSNVNPGWNGTGVPNAAGATATITSSNSNFTITQDNVSGVTIGSLTLTGSGTALTTINATNPITLNNSGSGATINNADTSTSGRITISGSLTLADNLLVENTGSNASTSGSILLSANIGGTGNITFSNVSNSTTTGYINVQPTANTFTGNVLIQKGAVLFQKAPFGANSNVVTLGSAGQGSATLASEGLGANALSINQSIIVAAGTGGTLVLGAIDTGAASFTYNGTVTLNGDVSLTSAKTGANAVIYAKAISGVGAVTVIGGGNTALTAGNTAATGNTFSGNTRVASGTLQLGASSGNTTYALQDSTLDMNSADSGAVSFGTSNTTTIVNATIGGLRGSRNLDLDNANSTPVAVSLSVGNNNTNQTYSGQLTGAGALAKTGTGTQTLTGSNTYAGGTTVSAGTLLVGNGNNGSATGTGALLVGSSGTIGGSGNLLTGTSQTSSFTINGHVIVGNGSDATSSLKIAAPSSGTVDGTLSGANLTFNLDSASAHANLLDLGSTNVTFSSTTLTLNLLGTNVIAPYSPYTLITDAVGFNSVTDGLTTQSETINGVTYNVITGGLNIASSTYFGASVNGFTTGVYPNSFLYIDSTGDNIDVMVVPEPSTWAMMLGGFCVLVFLQRRKAVRSE